MVDETTQDKEVDAPMPRGLDDPKLGELKEAFESAKLESPDDLKGLRGQAREIETHLGGLIAEGQSALKDCTQQVSDLVNRKIDFENDNRPDDWGEEPFDYDQLDASRQAQYDGITQQLGQLQQLEDKLKVNVSSLENEKGKIGNEVTQLNKQIQDAAPQKSGKEQLAELEQQSEMQDALKSRLAKQREAVADSHSVDVEAEADVKLNEPMDSQKGPGKLGNVDKEFGAVAKLFGEGGPQKQEASTPEPGKLTGVDEKFGDVAKLFGAGGPKPPENAAEEVKADKQDQAPAEQTMGANIPAPPPPPPMPGANKSDSEAKPPEPPPPPPMPGEGTQGSTPAPQDMGGEQALKGILDSIQQGAKDMGTATGLDEVANTPPPLPPRDDKGLQDDVSGGPPPLPPRPDELVNTAKDALSAPLDIAKGAVETVKDAVSAPLDIAKGAVGTVKDAVSAPVEMAKDAGKAIESVAKDAVSAPAEMVQGGLDAAKGAVEDTVEAAKNVGETLKDTVKDAVKGPEGADEVELGAKKTPHLELVGAATQALDGLKDAMKLEMDAKTALDNEEEGAQQRFDSAHQNRMDKAGEYKESRTACLEDTISKLENDIKDIKSQRNEKVQQLKDSDDPKAKQKIEGIEFKAKEQLWEKNILLNDAKSELKSLNKDENKNDGIFNDDIEKANKQINKEDKKLGKEAQVPEGEDPELSFGQKALKNAKHMADPETWGTKIEDIGDSPGEQLAACIGNIIALLLTPFAMMDQKEEVSQAWDDRMDSIKDTLNGLKEKFGGGKGEGEAEPEDQKNLDVVSNLQDALADAGPGKDNGNALKAVVAEGEKVEEMASKAPLLEQAKGLADTIKPDGPKPDEVVQVAKDAVSAPAEMVKGGLDTAKGAVEDTVEAAKNVGETLKDTAKDAVKGPGGADEVELGAKKTPHLELVGAATQALDGLKDAMKLEMDAKTALDNKEEGAQERFDSAHQNRMDKAGEFKESRTACLEDTISKLQNDKLDIKSQRDEKVQQLKDSDDPKAKQKIEDVQFKAKEQLWEKDILLDAAKSELKSLNKDENKNDGIFNDDVEKANKQVDKEDKKLGKEAQVPEGEDPELSFGQKAQKTAKHLADPETWGTKIEDIGDDPGQQLAATIGNIIALLLTPFAMMDQKDEVKQAWDDRMDSIKDTLNGIKEKFGGGKGEGEAEPEDQNNLDVVSNLQDALADAGPGKDNSDPLKAVLAQADNVEEMASKAPLLEQAKGLADTIKPDGPKPDEMVQDAGKGLKDAVSAPVDMAQQATETKPFDLEEAKAFSAGIGAKLGTNEGEGEILKNVGASNPGASDGVSDIDLSVPTGKGTTDGVEDKGPGASDGVEDVEVVQTGPGMSDGTPDIEKPEPKPENDEVELGAKKTPHLELVGAATQALDGLKDAMKLEMDAKTALDNKEEGAQERFDSAHQNRMDKAGEFKESRTACLEDTISKLQNDKLDIKSQRDEKVQQLKDSDDPKAKQKIEDTEFKAKEQLWEKDILLDAAKSELKSLNKDENKNDGIFNDDVEKANKQVDKEDKKLGKEAQVPEGEDPELSFGQKAQKTAKHLADPETWGTKIEDIGDDPGQQLAATIGNIIALLLTPFAMMDQKDEVKQAWDDRMDSIKDTLNGIKEKLGGKGKGDEEAEPENEKNLEIANNLEGPLEEAGHNKNNVDPLSKVLDQADNLAEMGPQAQLLDAAKNLAGAMKDMVQGIEAPGEDKVEEKKAEVKKEEPAAEEKKAEADKPEPKNKPDEEEAQVALKQEAPKPEPKVEEIEASQLESSQSGLSTPDMSGEGSNMPGLGGDMPGGDMGGGYVGMAERTNTTVGSAADAVDKASDPSASEEEVDAAKKQANKDAVHSAEVDGTALGVAAVTGADPGETAQVLETVHQMDQQTLNLNEKVVEPQTQNLTNQAVDIGADANTQMKEETGMNVAGNVKQGSDTLGSVGDLAKGGNDPSSMLKGDSGSMSAPAKMMEGKMGNPMESVSGGANPADMLKGGGKDDAGGLDINKLKDAGGGAPAPTTEITQGLGGADPSEMMSKGPGGLAGGDEGMSKVKQMAGAFEGGNLDKAQDLGKQLGTNADPMEGLSGLTKLKDAGGGGEPPGMDLKSSMPDPTELMGKTAGGGKKEEQEAKQSDPASDLMSNVQNLLQDMHDMMKDMMQELTQGLDLKSMMGGAMGGGQDEKSEKGMDLKGMLGGAMGGSDQENKSEKGFGLKDVMQSMMGNMMQGMSKGDGPGEGPDIKGIMKGIMGGGKGDGQEKEQGMDLKGLVSGLMKGLGGGEGGGTEQGMDFKGLVKGLMGGMGGGGQEKEQGMDLKSMMKPMMQDMMKDMMGSLKMGMGGQDQKADKGMDLKGMMGGKGGGGGMPEMDLKSSMPDPSQLMGKSAGGGKKEAQEEKSGMDLKGMMGGGDKGSKSAPAKMMEGKMGDPSEMLSGMGGAKPDMDLKGMMGGKGGDTKSEEKSEKGMDLKGAMGGMGGMPGGGEEEGLSKVKQMAGAFEGGDLDKAQDLGKQLGTNAEPMEALEKGADLVKEAPGKILDSATEMLDSVAEQFDSGGGPAKQQGDGEDLGKGIQQVMEILEEVAQPLVEMASTISGAKDFLDNEDRPKGKDNKKGSDEKEEKGAKAKGGGGGPEDAAGAAVEATGEAIEAGVDVLKEVMELIKQAIVQAVCAAMGMPAPGGGAEGMSMGMGGPDGGGGMKMPGMDGGGGGGGMPGMDAGGGGMDMASGDPSSGMTQGIGKQAAQEALGESDREKTPEEEQQDEMVRMAVKEGTKLACNACGIPPPADEIVGEVVAEVAIKALDEVRDAVDSVDPTAKVKELAEAVDTISSEITSEVNKVAAEANKDYTEIDPDQMAGLINDCANASVDACGEVFDKAKGGMDMGMSGGQSMMPSGGPGGGMPGMDAGASPFAGPGPDATPEDPTKKAGMGMGMGK